RSRRRESPRSGARSAGRTLPRQGAPWSKGPPQRPRSSDPIRSSVALPDEAEQEHRDRQEGGNEAQRPEIGLRKNHHVGHQRQIVQRQEDKTQRSPEQQARAHLAPCAEEEKGAEGAGAQAKAVHDRGPKKRHDWSPRSLKASD